MTTAKEITDRITWQPIETAPKNVKVLAAYQNELGNWRIVTACYHTQLDWSEEYGDHEEDFAPEAWYEESDSSEVIYPTSRVPTHWMPLPSNPSATDDNILLSALADAERERDDLKKALNATEAAFILQGYGADTHSGMLAALEAVKDLSRKNRARAEAAEHDRDEARAGLDYLKMEMDAGETVKQELAEILEAFEPRWKHLRIAAIKMRDRATAAESTLSSQAALLEEARKVVDKPFCVLFLDGRNEHGSHVMPSFPRGFEPIDDDISDQAEAILAEAERLGFAIGEHVWADFVAIDDQIGDEGRIELSGYWEFDSINVEMSRYLNARVASKLGASHDD